jgi:hypothetical protein
MAVLLPHALQTIRPKIFGTNSRRYRQRKKPKPTRFEVGRLSCIGAGRGDNGNFPGSPLDIAIPAAMTITIRCSLTFSGSGFQGGIK